MTPFNAGNYGVRVDGADNIYVGNTTASSSIPPDPKQFAPGLRMSDLDALLREHYAKGYHDGERKAWDAATERIRQERQRAAEEAAQKATADLLQWMWPNVMNKVLTASEAAASVLDAPKSTIAHDRKTVDRILHLLKQSLHSFHGKRAS